MKYTRIRKLVLAVLLLTPAILQAETVYINDVLRVVVRPEPSNSVTPTGVVITGMKLEVLERSEGFIRIRNEQGLEGWIKEMYVSEQPPAQLELAELQRKYQQLVEEGGQANEKIKASDEQRASLQSQVEALKADNVELQDELQEYRRKTDKDSTIGIYIIIGLSMVVLFLAGLVIGINWHRQQVTKKLGGLRF